MTVLTNKTRNDYVGTGGVTTYSYQFKIFNDSELLVYRTDEFGNATLLTLNTDYTVTGAGDAAGGEIELTTALPNNYTLAILRNLPLTQETAFRNQGAFYPARHEDAFDKSVMLAQQISEELGRVVVAPPSTNPGVSFQLPAPDPDHILGWNTAGTALENKTGISTDGMVDLANQVDPAKGAALVGLIGPDGGTNTVSEISSYDAGKGDALIAVLNGTGAISRTQHDKNIERISVKDYGAVGDGITDDTDAIQLAINSISYIGKLYVPKGVYLIDPSKPILLKEGLTIQGDGRFNTQFLCKSVGGTVFKRQRNTDSANEYMTSILLQDFGIIFRHPDPANPSNYVQIGIDFHSITRSIIENVYIGNYLFGISTTLGLDQPSSHANARQGIGVILSSTSNSDPAYCGGEVNRLHDVFIAGVQKGITIDDPAYFNPGYSSASYSNVIYAEVQIAEIGIAQWTQYGAGNTFDNIIIQGIGLATDSVTAHTYGLYIRGYANIVYGGYNENPTAEYDIYLDVNSRENRILPRLTDGVITDLGTNNYYEQFNSVSGKWEISINNDNIMNNRVVASVEFYYNGSAIVIVNSYRITNVVYVGVGDYRIDFPSGLFEDGNYIASLSASDSSGNMFLVNVRTPAAYTKENCRIISYLASGLTPNNPGIVKAIFFK